MPDLRVHEARAGPRRARHLVLVRPLAALHTRLARADRGPALLLPDVRPGNGLRHPLLLGRAHDHAGPLQHRRGPLPPRLSARPHPRRRRAQDDEEPRERRRPARQRSTSTAPMRCASRSRPAARRATTSGSPTRGSRRAATSRTRSGTPRASSSRASATRSVRLPEDKRTLAKRHDWPLEDRWIVSRVLSTAQDVNQHLSAFQINEAARLLYEFFWSEFATGTSRWRRCA